MAHTALPEGHLVLLMQIKGARPLDATQGASQTQLGSESGVDEHMQGQKGSDLGPVWSRDPGNLGPHT